MGKDVSVAWVPNTEPDLDHYNAYRAIMGKGVTSSWEQVSNAIPAAADKYTFVNLDDSVRWAFMITAVDKSGNESKLSNMAFEIKPPSTLKVMHVDLNISGSVSVPDTPAS